jgi:ABC-type transport system involved in cytochrome bd biosynthesis fused ATPase/permease subunit
LILLDRVLAHYGPESKESRDQLRSTVVSAIEQMSSKDRTGVSQTAPSSAGSEALYDKIQALSPKTDAQRSIQSQALSIVISIGQTRWLMYEQRAGSGSVPLLMVLIFWLTALFVSFGLFAPRNATVYVTFLVSAISVSGAILLILEMYTPYAGLIQISDAPLRTALAHLGQ